MARKKKTYDDDDGRTIVDMNVEGMPWYRKTSPKKVPEEDKPTRKETAAMIRAWFAAYWKQIVAVTLGFGITIALLVCWLNGWFL